MRIWLGATLCWVLGRLFADSWATWARFVPFPSVTALRPVPLSWLTRAVEIVWGGMADAAPASACPVEGSAPFLSNCLSGTAEVKKFRKPLKNLEARFGSLGPEGSQLFFSSCQSHLATRLELLIQRQLDRRLDMRTNFLTME